MSEHEHSELPSSRRNFLKTSALVAAAGTVYGDPAQASAAAAQAPHPAGPQNDSYAIAAAL